MIYYLTYNDLPSGIYSSQVIDVVKFLNTELKVNVNLIAFISLRNFLSNRKKIKNELPEAIVLPMFPGIQRWRQSLLLLRLISHHGNPRIIIGRSVLATQLALMLKDKTNALKVIYDGRGAIAAEWKEYAVVNNNRMINEIFELEKEAVLESDFRIAVSEQLVNYWQKEFGYQLNDHVLIPCTINNVYEDVVISTELIRSVRDKFGIREDDIVFIYSGSLAGWQSFELLYSFIKPVLALGNIFKVIFLSDRDENIKKLEFEFASQVFCMKTDPNDVANYLLAADYGLLIREETMTNKVASPVKFAEYLACGLKVIISDNLGDYTELIENNKILGYNLKPDIKKFTKPDLPEKNEIRKKGLELFSKKSHIEKYSVLLS